MGFSLYCSGADARVSYMKNPPKCVGGNLRIISCQYFNQSTVSAPAQYISQFYTAVYYIFAWSSTILYFLNQLCHINSVHRKFSNKNLGIISIRITFHSKKLAGSYQIFGLEKWKEKYPDLKRRHLLAVLLIFFSWQRG
jgi:hypothetical protein